MSEQHLTSKLLREDCMPSTECTEIVGMLHVVDPLMVGSGDSFSELRSHGTCAKNFGWVLKN